MRCSATGIAGRGDLKGMAGLPLTYRRKETPEFRVGIECGGHYHPVSDHRIESAWGERHPFAEFDQHSTGYLPLRLG